MKNTLTFICKPQAAFEPDLKPGFQRESRIRPSLAKAACLQKSAADSSRSFLRFSIPFKKGRGNPSPQNPCMQKMDSL